VALKAVLNDASKFDAGLCCGDIVGYGPNPHECIEMMIKYNFHCIRGNHDNAVSYGETDWFNDEAQEAIRINRKILPKSDIEWLGRLPLEVQLELENLKVALYHGSPTEPLTSYIFPKDAEKSFKDFFEITKSDIIILGHTHIPYILKKESQLMINPGSTGQPRDKDHRASYMILDTDEPRVDLRRVEYNIDATVNAMHSLRIPYRIATRLYHGL